MQFSFVRTNRVSAILLMLLLYSFDSGSQNALAIPTAINGTTFNLNIQNGTTQFYSGINTPTYGINGNILAPTLVIHKWDQVTIHISNSLTGFGNSTTMHWHGLHVAPHYDGGPHQVIAQGTTWHPAFQMLNNAGTFWYHPHGNNKTDLHVSKGLAGMIIVKDSNEESLTLPRRYGIDDFPVIVQTKAFDILNQIAISTEFDTAVCVNGVINPYLNIPSQVVRLRLLNGSSSRSYQFGFTGNMPFYMIAGDAGLLDSTLTLSRLMLSPGERAEILLDLQGKMGDTIYLKSYSSEMPNGIYGAATVRGPLGGNIPEYDQNPLNGADFNILQFRVVQATDSAVTSIPLSLTQNIKWDQYQTARNFNLSPDTMSSPLGQVAGPFNINGEHFAMDHVNVTTYLNTTEKWRVTNQTGIAHPFHMHDVHFYLLNINGDTVPAYQRGRKDVVLVPPMKYVEFITKFEDFADDSVPYMYHCHLLHHEDDGMMGSFLVRDTAATGLSESSLFSHQITIYPNPLSGELNITSENLTLNEIQVFDLLGKLVFEKKSGQTFEKINMSGFRDQMYVLKVMSGNRAAYTKILKQSGQ